MGEVSLNRPLARGRTADVYPWEEGYVLKRFHESFDLEAIQNEARISRAVHANGLPVPLAREILQVDGSYGLVYERVDGSDMFAVLQRQPWRVFQFARRFADLHVQMHARACPTNLPPQKERLASKIRRVRSLSTQVQGRLLFALGRLPAGERVCHGDFHPGNVLLADKGEVVIDWIDATCGNPLADLARSSIIALGVAESEQVSNAFLKVFVRIFHGFYISRYFRQNPGDVQEYRSWLPIVAGARLSEEIPELEAWLLEKAQGIL